MPNTVAKHERLPEKKPNFLFMEERAFQLRDNNTIFHSVFDRNSKSSMSCNRNLQPRFSSLAVNCFYKLSSPPHIKVNGHVALDRIGGRAGSQTVWIFLKDRFDNLNVTWGKIWDPLFLIKSMETVGGKTDSNTYNNLHSRSFFVKNSSFPPQ